MDTSRPNSLIFDLDGTLTASRGVISAEMSAVLIKLSEKFQLWITSGADYDRVERQLGIDLIRYFTGIYCCNGSFKYVNGRCVRTSRCSMPAELSVFLQSVFTDSSYHTKTCPTVLEYPCMINFSVVPPDASAAAREDYYVWDQNHHERKNLVDAIRLSFPELNASIGGRVSIDITYRILDKSFIILDDDLIGPVAFFGDQIHGYGNDFTIANSIVDRSIGVVHKVTSPEDTLKLIKKYAE